MEFEIAPEVVDGGVTLWRAEVWRDGRLVDATRLTASPRQAHSDGEALARGVYWCDGDNPHQRWSTAA